MSVFLEPKDGGLVLSARPSKCRQVSSPGDEESLSELMEEVKKAAEQETARAAAKEEAAKKERDEKHEEMMSFLRALKGPP